MWHEALQSMLTLKYVIIIQHHIISLTHHYKFKEQKAQGTYWFGHSFYQYIAGMENFTWSSQCVSLFHIPVLSGDPSTFIFSCPQYFSIIISCGKNYLSVVMITAFSLCLPRQERYSFEQLLFLPPLLRQFGIDNKRFFRDTPMNIIMADVSGFCQPIFFLKCWERRAYLLQIKND